MRRRSFLTLCLCSSLFAIVGAAHTASAKPKKQNKNDSNGWVWTYTAQSGKRTESGTFRVRNFEVFKNGKKVGHIDPKGGHGLGDKTVLILTDFAPINGRVLLEKTHAKPPVWLGTLNAKDGRKWQFKAKLATKK
jgi:hypothetical protein